MCLLWSLRKLRIEAYMDMAIETLKSGLLGEEEALDYLAATGKTKEGRSSHNAANVPSIMPTSGRSRQGHGY